MNRGAIHEVAGKEGHHRPVPTVVIAQVNDDRVGVGEKLHRGGRSPTRELRVGKHVEVEVADVPRPPFEA